MSGFMPLAHIPMLFGILGALSSVAFLPFGVWAMLGIAACGATLFMIGLTVAIVQMVFRTDLEWQQALGIDQ